MRTRSRIILLAAYLSVCALAAAPLIGASDPLAGVFLILVSAPWSFVGVGITDAISPALTDIVGPLLPIAGVALNAALLWWLTGRVGARDGEQTLPIGH